MNLNCTWIVGTIDAYGAIEARAVEMNVTHTFREQAGRPWRWNVHQQDWDEFTTLRLTEDEMIAVENWLTKNGYKRA